MLGVATELTEVKEQAGLPLAALDKSVWVKQFFDDSSLSYRWVVHGVVLRGIVCRTRWICRVTHRTTIHVECSNGETVTTTWLQSITVITTISSRARVFPAVSAYKQTELVIQRKYNNIKFNFKQLNGTNCFKSKLFLADPWQLFFIDFN